MPISITEERPDTPDAQVLIEELEAHLATLYAREVGMDSAWKSCCASAWRSS